MKKFASNQNQEILDLQECRNSLRTILEKIVRSITNSEIEELGAILSHWGEIESNVQRLLASDLITFSSNFEKLRATIKRMEKLKEEHTVLIKEANRLLK